MFVLSKEDMDEVFSMVDAINSNKLAFKIHSSGKSNAPVRTAIKNEKQDGVTLFMPGAVDEMNILGQKIVSVYPKNNSKNIPIVTATMMLMDADTGMLKCILDGTYLTKLRTGAGAGAATDILARENAKVGAVIGSGAQALKQLEAMVCVRKLNVVKVYSRDDCKLKKFVDVANETLKDYKTKIIAVTRCEDAICDADIITLITNSIEPVIDGNMVKAGAHINAVGAYTHQMREIDDVLIKKANKIYVDSIKSAMQEAGDILIPLRKNIINENDITGEIGQILMNDIKGRTCESEITIFKSVGIAEQDLISANDIYKKAMNLNKCKYIKI